MLFTAPWVGGSIHNDGHFPLPQAMNKLSIATLRLGRAALLLAAAVALGAAQAAPGASIMAPAASAPGLHGMPPPRQKAPPVPVKRIDINSASKAELKKLPHIDDATAERLIKGRPYLTKTELVSKKVLPLGPYIAIKDRVIALQKKQPKPKS